MLTPILRALALHGQRLQACLPRYLARSAAASDWPRRLERGLRDLQSLSDQVEQQFVAVGSLFSDQVLLNDRIVGELDGLARLTGGSTGQRNVVEEAERLVADTLEFVADAAHRAQGLVEQLDRYDRQIARTQSGKAQFARTLIPLQIIERLFRIESASLPPEMQTAFASLTQEIAALHGQMRQTLDTQFEELSRTRDRIGRARTDLQAHVGRISQSVTDTRNKVADALANLQVHLAQARERDERLSQNARALSQETSALVVGLQSQDALRQRCEHVRDALKSLLESRGARSTRLSLRPRDLQLCRLEASQLASIDVAMAEATGGLSSGIASFAARLDRIERDCLSVDELGEMVNSSQSMTDALLQTLRNARKLLEEALEGIGATYEAIHSFGGTATNVTSTLRRLTLDIRLIALNAQIQAAQVGAGTGLEVLSERTCVLAEETEAFTGNIGLELEALIAALGSVVTECGDIREQSQERLARLDRDNRAEECGLLAHQSALSEALETTARLLEKSRGNARAMQSSVGDRPTDRSCITRLVETLREAMARSGRRALRGNDDDGELNELSRRYTMDAERAVHAAALAQRQLASSQLDSGNSDFFEFFERPSEGTFDDAIPLPDVARREGQSDSNVELF